MRSAASAGRDIAVVCLAVLTAGGCSHARHAASNEDTPANKQNPSTVSVANGARFVNVSTSAGIIYRWQIAAKRPLNILQTIGNGCAFLDYNQDGNIDILLIGPKLALYRGDGHGRFTDVTHETGLDAFTGDFLGCAVGDYDNDGYPDIYVSGYRTGLLLHNEKGVRFRDATPGSGLKPQPWGTSCAFADVDGDGKLDLYIADYLVFGPDTVPQLCKTNGHETACGPLYYRAERGVLYRNLGNGRFEDVTQKWGAGATAGKSLGAAFVPDYSSASHVFWLAVANDEEPGDLMAYSFGHFKNIGAQSGIAYGPTGKPQGGMGLDWGDYNNAGRPDLAVATFESEPKPIYRNSNGQFEDQSATLGAVDPLLRYVSFGIKWFDYDNDGLLDLIVSNGHISDNIADFNPSQTYRQPTVLLHNIDGNRFSDVSKLAGSDICTPIVGRGLAVGDFDNDGRVDVLVVDSEGAPVLLHNETSPSGHWLQLKLEGTGRSNRDAIGSVVKLRAGKLSMMRHCHTDGSYLSASDPRVHFGLGVERSADVTVRWPDGHTDMYKNLAADCIYKITEGAAAPALFKH